MGNQSSLLNKTTCFQPFWLLALTIFFYLIATPTHAMTVSEATKLLASDGEAENRFGTSVAISGNTAVIGAKTTGLAYVYVRDTNGNWNQQAKLVASDGNTVGGLVAISGNTVVISSKLAPPLASNSYVYVFVRNASGGWSQQAKIEQPTISRVSISGDTLLIGNDPSFIYVRDSNGAWSQQAKFLGTGGSIFFTPSGPSTVIDQFGASVSISGDTAVIGAPLTPVNSRVGAGAAYIYARSSDGSWIQQERLVHELPTRTDRFGQSVSISQNTAIIGVPGASSAGAAYIFDRDNSGVWSQRAQLLADDGETVSLFGSSVSISDNTAIIGSDNNGNNGPAYIFTRDSDGGWNQQTKLLPVDDNIGSSFNNTPVSISGDTAIIGAPSDNEQGSEAGATYVYDLSSPSSSSTLIDSGINFAGGPSILSDQFLAQELTLQNDAKITDISFYMFRESGINPQVIKAQLTSSIGPGTPSSELIEEYSFIVEPNLGLHLVSIPTSLNLKAGTYFLVLSSTLEQQDDPNAAAWAFRAPEDIGDSFILGGPVNTSFPPDSRIASSAESSYSLRISGEFITQPSGSCNKSVLLDGIDDWINLPDMNLSSDFTIEAWVKLAPGIDAVDALLGQNGSGPDINFHQQKMRLFIAQSPWDVVTANTPMQANVWTHIAITRSGSSLKSYINGQLGTGGVWAGIFPIKALGRGNRSPGGFAGEIDEVRLWEIARTTSQIMRSFKLSVDPFSPGLIGYWTFNRSGQTVMDSSNGFEGSLGSGSDVNSDDPTRLASTAPMVDACDGGELPVDDNTPIVQDDTATVETGGTVSLDVTANDGPNNSFFGAVKLVSPPMNGTAIAEEINGTITYTHDGSSATSDSFTYTLEDNEGRVSDIATVNITITQPSASCNRSVSLDGLNDFVGIPNLDLTDDFTIEAWVKLAPGIDAVDSLLGQSTVGPDINFHQGKVRLFIAQSPWDVVIANTVLQPNQWNHIAISRAGSNLSLYINGSLDATGFWDEVLSIQTLGRGNRHLQGGFAGEMDEVRIWDIARSAGEINQNYDRSVDSFSTGLLAYWNFNGSGQVVIDASNGFDGSLGNTLSTHSHDPTRLVSTAPLTDNCEGL
ncbi:MAG: LamG-like jellyroll fold domain-containing protein [Methylococcaceae bacterium]